MKSILRLLALSVLVMNTTTAIAYVGPGAGLSAIGSVLALLGAALLLIVGFVWYPVKRMLRKKKNKAEETTQQNSAED